VLKEQYDGHGHLLTFQNGSATDGTYGYDAFSRLVQRVVSNVSPAGTTQYLYDEFGHVVLETDGAGNSLREYIWLGDMPVAIIDQVNTATPVLYYVHVDHLNRPIMVTNSAGASVWTAVWTPFGTAQSVTGTLTYNARFPGQWFQIESGLHYNWNRHYDPSTGRYVQPDPTGLEALMRNGPSVYAYARQSPLAWIDPQGLIVDVPETPKEYQEREALGETTDEEDIDHGSGIDPLKLPPGAMLPAGGVYTLKDPTTGNVMRSGRTGNFCRREGEHNRDPNFSPYDFEREYPTDNYDEQRGLEQFLHDLHNPPLNKINPISPTNPNIDAYMKAAQDYLNRDR